MPLQATSGAASYDAFGGGVPVVPAYIEEVFSTFLYTGTGAAQTITNGIDLSGKGGLVWIKRRDASGDNILTVTGNGLNLSSNLTTDFINDGAPLFNSSGFDLVYGTSYLNASGGTYASWTFREQKKFFDVVTYTGSGANRTIAHNLGSEPACIIIKSTNRNSTDWAVYHRSLGNTQYIRLNNTGAAATSSTYWNNTTPTSTVFSLGTNADVNNSGGANYVAYLFAHDAGGFGLTGTDNVISCGTFTTDAFKTGFASLPFSEAQWILVKCASNAGSWFIVDNMRGIYTNATDANGLSANTSAAETTRNIDYGNSSSNSQFRIFGGDSVANSDFIYIAIRRGPMKVPTSGTSVFSPTAWTGSGATRNTTTGFVTDLNISRMRQNFSSGDNLGAYWESRLTGATQYLHSDSTAAEASQTDGLTSFASNTGLTFGADSTVQAWNYDNNYRNWSFKRAPSYMDVVCYTGTGSATSLSHNLQAVPELMIVKRRNATNNWAVYSSALGNTNRVFLNQTQASASDSTLWNNTTPTSSVFTVGTAFATNNSGDTYVAHLFATCAGVSKVGSYTGNGSSQTINCGFTAGARFVMVKATSTTGNWICVDTNGINAGVDRALYMNNADLEDFTYDWIDIDSTGFIVNETSTIAANTNGVTYIFLAIA